MVGSVSVIPKGTGFHVEWKMQDYISREQRVNVYVYSPPFFIDDRLWELLLYPNGSIYNDSVGYTVLCLHRKALFGAPIIAEFSFGFKTINGIEDLEIHCSEVFTSKSHRIYSIISKPDFLRRKSEIVTSGVLTVVCKFKRLHHIENISNFATVKCSYCKKSFNTEEISSHEEKCRIKCPHCSDVILLQNWEDHECQISRAEAATNTTESFAVHTHNKILQDFKELFLKPDNSDAVIRVKGREFSVHKAILAARSPVFASIFRNDMKEKKTGIVDIEDCDPSVFPDFLCFLYSGGVLTLSEKTMFGLFTFADKYDVSDLKTKCLEFFKENISVATFCEILNLSLQYTEDELIQLTTDFFIKNAEKILVTIKWQSFAAEHPTKSNELVIKLATSYRCSKS